MNFSIEITKNIDLSNLPRVKDVYITMLPGNDYKEVVNKALELSKSGFNPVPHFPARSIKNLGELRDYVNRCKDGGVKQALVIGGSAQPIGDFHCSLQLL
jgi:methylenetetrahydrofolate reductase (NADPH)